MWLWHCRLEFGVICDGFVLVVVIGEAEDGEVCFCKYSLFPMKNETIFCVEQHPYTQREFRKTTYRLLIYMRERMKPGLVAI
jgi:hypothetical protein